MLLICANPPGEKPPTFRAPGFPCHPRNPVNPGDSEHFLFRERVKPAARTSVYRCHAFLFQLSISALPTPPRTPLRSARVILLLCGCLRTFPETVTHGFPGYAQHQPQLAARASCSSGVSGFIVLAAGFEPAIFCLRGRRVNRFLQASMFPRTPGRNRTLIDCLEGSSPVL